MKTFYTNVCVHGSRILYRGVESGRRVRQKIDYHPTLYIQSKTPTEFKTITGEYVSEIKPGNIRDCRDFVKKYEDVENFKIYGNQRYEHTFIAEHFPDDIEWDRSLINVAILDLECMSDSGFPNPDVADQPITAISIRLNRTLFVFGTGDFSHSRDDLQYYRSDSEIDLLKKFLDIWCADYPDIVSGWNVKFFDLPYLVNRIKRVLGEDSAKRLSPWNVLLERKTTIMNREQTSHTLLGISTLDYLELYKKFAPGGTSQESYKLDNIAHVELGERKLSYEEYGNLNNLYKENYQLFLDYNIIDVELVEKLDEKLKLIDLALTLAYDSKTNTDDVFTQTRMWDQLIHTHLLSKNIVVPPNEKQTKTEAYVGAYVKDPIVGRHNWIASFDLTSLYPSLIIQWNISPETLVQPEEFDTEMHTLRDSVSVDKLLRRELDTSILKKKNISLCPNGQFFRNDRAGFMPVITDKMFADRQRYKKKMLAARQAYETETNESRKRELTNEIAKFNNLQTTKKISLNSLYGSSGTPYFRFYDIRLATAITTSGQLVIQWIANDINEYLNKLLGTKDKDFCIASDTDSIYLSLDELVRKTIMDSNPTAGTREIISFLDRVCENKIQPFIDKSCDALAGYLNVYSQRMRMKREALADKGIWTAKKRYALNVYNNEGVEYAKPKIKVTGLEMIKSSTPSACREKLMTALDVVLNGTESDIIAFIEKFRAEFRTLPESDIAFPRGVNGISEYTDQKTKTFTKGTPIHVRGSIVYNNLLHKKNLTSKYETIKEGEKIKFIYLKEPNTIQSNVIAFSGMLPKELDLTKYIDFETQFEKAFLDPLKIILNCIGWKTEATSSLEAFFG